MRFQSFSRWSRVTRALGFLTAACFLALPSSGGQAARPLNIIWTKGACANCKVADRLSHLAFARGAKVWAFGFLPPGGMGAGDATILHSEDGGRRWRELGWTFTHNNDPMASFSNPNDGWIAYVDMDSAELRIMSTHDGSTWHRVPLNDFFITAIQYVGEGTGFAFSSDIYTHAARLWATKDGGRSWKHFGLPTGFTADQMRFANERDGYLAGCLRQRLTIFSTHDGGGKWTESALPSLPLGDLGHCSLEFDGMSLITPQEAWVLASKHSFGRDDKAGMVKVWRTADGGRTWTAVYHEAFTEDDELGTRFDGPYALTAKLIVVFRETAGGRPEALVSGDNGRTWSSTPLRHPIAGCAKTAAGLTCVGGGVGFWVAKVAISPRSGTVWRIIRSLH